MTGIPIWARQIANIGGLNTGYLRDSRGVALIVKKSIMIRTILASLVAAGLLSACDVQTYDDAASDFNSSAPPPADPPPADPPPDPPPPGASFGPNFSEIQAAVFTTTCATSGCHAGANPAASLNLEAANSYAMLVGVASSQDANIERVNAGNPDISYLIQKLEGTAATGDVMPPSGMLPQVDIDVIRQWISDGAIDDTVLPPAAPIQVASLSPAPNSDLPTPPAQIIAGFTRDLDQSTVNAQTFLVTASGGDGIFGNGNDTQVTAAAINVPSNNPRSAIFDLTGVTLNDDTYEVRLLGAGASVIMDLDANALDGENVGAFPSGNGAAGGNYVTRFTITTPIVLGPTLPQIQAVIFTPTCATVNCHFGGAPDAGLNLEDGNSYMNLVGVTSSQDANFMRVAAGDPDNSYLVRKLEGNGTVPTIMPPTGMLPAAQITAIRDWIAAGAPEN